MGNFDVDLCCLGANTGHNRGRLLLSVDPPSQTGSCCNEFPYFLLILHDAAWLACSLFSFALIATCRLKYTCILSFLIWVNIPIQNKSTVSTFHVFFQVGETFG